MMSFANPLHLAVDSVALFVVAPSTRRRRDASPQTACYTLSMLKGRNVYDAHRLRDNKKQRQKGEGSRWGVPRDSLPAQIWPLYSERRGLTFVRAGGAGIIHHTHPVRSDAGTLNLMQL